MIEKIKSKFQEWKEKREFLGLVDDSTKELRRQAYLNEKKLSAIEEGKIIAKKELEKQRQNLEMEKQKTKNMNSASSTSSTNMFEPTQNWDFGRKNG